MTKLRISVVQYLNTAPLVWDFTNGPLRGKYDLSFTVPSQCAEALRTGAADVAIIPAIEYQRIVSRGLDLVVLPDLAIASKHRVASLLLIAKAPIASVRSIALDRSSRSTQALVKILCARHWSISPKFTEADANLPAMLHNADAALLIGDPALQLSCATAGETWSTSPSGYICAGRYAGINDTPDLYLYDIAEEWRHLTGKPAVLALWAARAELVTPELTADFLTSRDAGLRHVPEICSEASRQMQLPPKDLRFYLEQNIDYSLDEENIQGLLHFFGFSFSLGIIDALRPVSIAASPTSHARQIDFPYASQPA